MSYLTFHAIFILPPIALLSLLVWRRDTVRIDSFGYDARWVGLGIIITLAVLYTTPWDNYLILRGVWWYGDGTTAFHIWAAPIGEYLFFVLQPILTGLWLYLIADRPADFAFGDITTGQRLAGLGAAGVVGALSVWLLLLGPQGLYMGSLLLWSVPILAIQWAFGWPYLWKVRRLCLLAIVPPTLYLWAVDWYAITVEGIWTISAEHTLGPAPASLPLEEMTFFLLTNVFVVQGLVMYLWIADRWL
ncbi:MAG: lycopene cyclase domain-containing protein [Natronomonas sp.]